MPPTTNDYSTANSNGKAAFVDNTYLLLPLLVSLYLSLYIYSYPSLYFSLFLSLSFLPPCLFLITIRYLPEPIYTIIYIYTISHIIHPYAQPTQHPRTHTQTLVSRSMTVRLAHSKTLSIYLTIQ